MKILETAYNLLYSSLIANCPVLSGNLKNHLQSVKLVGTKMSEHEITVSINAPFYDVAKWKKTGEIVHLKKKVLGRTSYAAWLNELGAFGKRNKSKGWANRSCMSMAIALSMELEKEGYETEINYLLGE